MRPMSNLSPVQQSTAHYSMSSNLTTLTGNNLQAVASKSALPLDGKPQKQPARNIVRHTKRPPSERRFKCDQCDRMFFTRKDVKRHLVVHTGIRNFACDFCSQRFGRKDHL